MIRRFKTSSEGFWGARRKLRERAGAANGSASYTLTISVPPDTTGGTYDFTVTGMGGGLIRSASLTVTVPSAATGGDFSISASPSMRNVKGTGTASYAVTLTSINGYDSPVDLSVDGLPIGWTSTFDPVSPVTPTATGATTTLTVGVNVANAGTYLLTITGTDSTGLTHSATVTLKDR